MPDDEAAKAGVLDLFEVPLDALGRAAGLVAREAARLGALGVLGFGLHARPAGERPEDAAMLEGIRRDHEAAMQREAALEREREAARAAALTGLSVAEEVPEALAAAPPVAFTEPAAAPALPGFTPAPPAAPLPGFSPLPPADALPGFTALPPAAPLPGFTPEEPRPRFQARVPSDSTFPEVAGRSFLPGFVAPDPGGPMIVRTESASDILLPDGLPIGTEGTDPSIREMPGGLAAAQAMFERLRQGALTSPRRGTL
jgi:hypothetical protein